MKRALPSLRIPSWRRLRRDTVGTPPGSLVPSQTDTPTHIHVITFSAETSSVEEDHFDIVPGDGPPDILTQSFDGVRWINIVGVHDGELLREIGGTYGIHHLLLEDIQHTDQRPKFDERGDAFFGVLRMISWQQMDGANSGRLDIEQVSLYSAGNYVISFQERPGDVFEGIRDRIRTGRGRVRRSGSDYLFYAIIDAVIDTAFIVVDEIQEQIEAIEDRIIADPHVAPLSVVHLLRGEVVAIRRALRPLREMLQNASKGNFTYFSETTYPFLSDGYDHILALIDSADAQMDRVTGLFQLHGSMVGTSTNEVMRTLTIIATIFIPLTFIVGIYGMNFATMPELGWRYGYPTVLGAMVVVAIGMIVYFKRRRWF